MNNINNLLSKFNALSLRERALIWAGVMLAVGVLIDYSFTDSSKLKAVRLEIKKSSTELAELIRQRQSISLPPLVVKDSPKSKEIYKKLSEAKRDKLFVDEVGGHKLHGEIASNSQFGITRLELQEVGKESEEFHGFFVHSMSLEGVADWGTIQDLMANYLSNPYLTVVRMKFTESQFLLGRVSYSLGLLVLSDSKSWYEPRKRGVQ